VGVEVGVGVKVAVEVGVLVAVGVANKGPMTGTLQEITASVVKSKKNPNDRKVRCMFDIIKEVACTVNQP
jgi:DNA-binding sugar fermentation-stimulating protein